jgi:hypothetical protein
MRRGRGLALMTSSSTTTIFRFRTAVERRNEQMGWQARASSMRLFAIYRQLIIQEMPHESNDELSGLQGSWRRSTPVVGEE